MIELIVALIIGLCDTGESVGNWYEYTNNNLQTLGTLQVHIRLSSDDGVINVYKWQNGVFFVSRPNSIHGQCARKDINATPSQDGGH